MEHYDDVPQEVTQQMFDMLLARNKDKGRIDGTFATVNVSFAGTGKDCHPVTLEKLDDE